MPHATKIATCCYCGTRAALVLRGKERHELACSTCGAPLHELKMLKSSAKGDRELVRPSAIRQKAKNRPQKHHRAPKKKKGRRTIGAWIASELWDAADDIFDDVLDIFD